MRVARPGYDARLYAWVTLRCCGPNGDSPVINAGDFLEEDVYAEWAISLREQARAAFIAVARGLAEGAAAIGDHDMTVRCYLRILEHDPYDEDTHLGLVSISESHGRHGEARRYYHSYVARMTEIEVQAAPFPGGSAGSNLRSHSGEFRSTVHAVSSSAAKRTGPSKASSPLRLATSISTDRETARDSHPPAVERMGTATLRS